VAVRVQVISPDPNLKVTEVGVPMHIAMHMTYPERVSRYNIAKLRQCVINGMTQHPGANFVIFPDGNKWCASRPFGHLLLYHLKRLRNPLKRLGSS